jgi:uncharacterized protein (DUF2235 family)
MALSRVRGGEAMTKRIVVCSDGTWNVPDQRHPTNVVKMARAIAPSAPDGKSQIVFYDQGVGTGNFLDRLTGGAFGRGLEKNVEDGYRFLMHNYEDGDEIFFFGFSRGSYTVRSTAGLIRNSGLLYKVHAGRFPDAYELYRSRDAHPNSEEAQGFRRDYSREVTVHFIGVWDTVGALGIPVRGLRWLTKGKYEFHDVELSRYVKHGYHALAIDERRGPFNASLWENKEKPGQVVEQVWFAGVHSDVGGGYQESGLADIAFLWMKQKAEDCGLAFDEEYVAGAANPVPLEPVHNSMTGLYRLTRGISRRVGKGEGANEAVHPDVVLKHESASPPYRPDNLVEYLNDPEHKIAKVKDRD